MSGLPVALDAADLERLRWAAQRLEGPRLAACLSGLVGIPMASAVKLLPRSVYIRAHQLAESAVGQVMDAALVSLRHVHEHDRRNGLYRGLAAGCGALGGAFGLSGLLLDLPVTTTLMLRSIAEIARAEGEDLATPEARLACLEVFALGGHAETDDAAEAGYYGNRLSLALPITRATRHLARHGLADPGAPVLVDLIRAVGARFGVVVSQKAAAQLVPLIGAAGGAAVNLIFMSHYQDVARGHFVVRALERRYGQAIVQANYEALRADIALSAAAAAGAKTRWTYARPPATGTSPSDRNSSLGFRLAQDL